MSSTMVKQIVVVIVALIGIADGIWGFRLLGQLTEETITVIVTLVLAALGLIEMQELARVKKGDQAQGRPKPPSGL